MQVYVCRDDAWIISISGIGLCVKPIVKELINSFYFDRGENLFDD